MKDLEEQLSTTQTKYSSLEKTKNRVAGELEDVMLDLEKERNATAAWEKKKKVIDQQINEWKAKYEGSQQELDASKSESRMYSTEVLFHLIFVIIIPDFMIFLIHHIRLLLDIFTI